MKRHLRLKTDFPLFRFLPERWTACLFLIGCLCCTACGDDEEDGYVYPSLLTEFVEVYTDAKGNGTQFVTDDGKIYAINSPIQGLQPDAAYRLVCGYEVTADYQEGHPVAKIYTVETVNLLKLKEEPSDTDDPLAVASIWNGGNYLNLHLMPKTQGGTQEWGYHPLFPYRNCLPLVTLSPAARRPVFIFHHGICQPPPSSSRPTRR